MKSEIAGFSSCRRLERFKRTLRFHGGESDELALCDSVKELGEVGMMNLKIHATAEVHPSASLGLEAVVWGWSQLRENVVVGPETSIGQSCYLGPGVTVGARCKIQNAALIYEPAVLADWVFVGPGAVLTNDRFPRAVNVDGSIKGPGDWEPVGVRVGTGASIGARAVLIGPLTIGKWATIGAGAVVSSDVKPFALVVGNPGRQTGWVGHSGARLTQKSNAWICPITGDVYTDENGALTLSTSAGLTGA